MPFQPTGTIVWGVLPVNSVPRAPGDRVRILGTELSAPSEVSFGGVPADLGTPVPADPDAPFLPGDNDFTITLSAGVTGTADVTVTANNETPGRSRRSPYWCVRDAVAAVDDGNHRVS